MNTSACPQGPAAELALPRTLAPLVLFLAATLPAPPALAQTPAAINRLLFDPAPLAASVTAPAPGPASATVPAATASGGDSAQDIALYLRNIAAEELAKGPFAPELQEQFFALGKAYQQEGNHEAALEAFGKADHISRINSGLYSPQQFAIIESMIASHVATGDVAEAHTSQQYLLFLKREYYGEDSLEVVPALETLGKWNLDAFRAILNQSNASRFATGLNTAVQVNGPSIRMLAFGNLFQAQSNFYQAIDNLLGHRRYAEPKLLELERNLVETSFFAANRQSILDNPDFYLSKRGVYTGTRIARSMRNNSMQYFNGRNAYQRMLIYQHAYEDSDPLAVARNIIELGDWQLLFGRQLGALDHYREAYRYLRDRGIPESTIDALMTPTVPVQLPVFTPLPHSREKFGIAADAALAYAGHIDLRFRISRFGNVSKVEVLGTGGTVAPDVERRLRKLLRSSPFRPRFNAGEALKSEEVTMRYYVAQMEDLAAVSR